MTCLPRQTLLELLAGRLSPEEAQPAAQHLSTCPKCQQRADELTEDPTVRQFFREHQQVRAPEGGDKVGLDELRNKLYALEETPTEGHLDPQFPSDPLIVGVPERGNRRASQATLAAHPRVLGRYHLKEVLGRGAFGVVYRAEDMQLNRPVALKLPRSSTLADPEGRRRFLREARAAGGLHHPHIVALYDAGEYDGLCHLASAYTPGPTLGRWLAQQGSDVAPDLAAQIVLALSDAVQHAHENGVLHRDIKPQNVLLDPTVSFRDLSFSPKLTDFGVAKLIDGDVEETMTGLVLGTPRYMAPEQAAGRQAEVGPACDIYALGVVLYELLTGTAPIQGTSHADTLRRVAGDEPVRPRKLRAELSRDLEAICLTCLEKEPRRRYASAAALSEDLRRYLERQPTRARPLRPHERLARWAWRQPATAGLIGVTVAAVILLCGGLAIHSRRLDAINKDLETALGEAQLAKADALESQSRTADLLYVSDLRLAGRAWKVGDMRSLAELLRRHRPDGNMDRRGFEWHFLQRIAQVSPRELVRSEQPV